MNSPPSIAPSGRARLARKIVTTSAIALPVLVGRDQARMEKIHAMTTKRVKNGAAKTKPVR